MPVLPRLSPVAPDDAADALVRAAAAAMDDASGHDRSALRHAYLPDEHRLDERTLAGLRARVAAVVGPVERSLRLGAAARLAAMQALAATERLLGDAEPVAPALTMLAAAGDAAILCELLAIVRLEALAEALPSGAASSVDLPNVDRPSLLVRLATCPEPEVAAAAAALMAALNRQSASMPPPLPAAMRERIVWWAAALLRDRLGDDPRVDHALVEAATELIADESDAPAPAAAAMRLAELVRARPEELAPLLLEALGDRQPTLFAALLAQASGLAFDVVRATLVEAAGDRLWLLLRAQDLDRQTIARIGVALADADPRRDLDRFAAALDAAMTVEPERAAQVFAAATLPAPYRESLADVAGM